MKSFDYTADDNDILMPKPSFFTRIRSRIHIPKLFSRKKMPDALTLEDEGEPPLSDEEAADLKGMIDSLTDASKKPSYTIPKIMTDIATPSNALSIPTPAPAKPWMRYVNTLVAILAFIGGAYGVMVLYNQFPTYPSIIIGIVAVSASAGVITGISTRG